MANPRIIVTLPPILKRVLEQTADHRECSNAEIVRAALYEHLREAIQQDTKGKR